MSIIPKGSICLPDLVEMVIANLHGQDAIAEISGVKHDGKETSFKIFDDFSVEGLATEKAKATKAWNEKHETLRGFESKWRKHVNATCRQKQKYVSRAGNWVLSTEDDKRWDGAIKKIRNALSRDKLKAYISPSSNQEQSIIKSYWMYEVPASITIQSGIYINPPKPELADCLVYVELKAANDWLENVKPDQQKGTSENQAEHPDKQSRAKRKGGRNIAPGGYRRHLTIFLIWYEKAHSKDGGLEGTTYKNLMDMFRKKAADDGIKGVPPSRNGLEEPMKRMIKEIVSEIE